MPSNIWVVVCDGEIVGIYPNDESKAHSVAETMREARFAPEIIKYIPERKTDDTPKKSA